MRRLAGRLKDLWAGRLPLADAFWTYNVFWGLLLNIFASISGFAVLVGMEGREPRSCRGISLAVHALPLLYNVIVLVGVWRSAGSPDCPPVVTRVARALALLLFAVFIFI